MGRKISATKGYDEEWEFEEEAGPLDEEGRANGVRSFIVAF